MDEYITGLLGQTAIVSTLVTAFVQMLKSTLDEKFFPARMYPWASIASGIAISMFIGWRINMNLYDAAAIGWISGLIAIGVFKYGKHEELISKIHR